MTREQVEKIIEQGTLPAPADQVELVETHISWVILAPDDVYKIKKPLQFSFLDLSTLEKRKYYCKRELELNRRLAPEVYRDVLPVKSYKDSFAIGESIGRTVDYALWMSRMDESRQLDRMLNKGEVRDADMKQLAQILANFHLHAERIEKSEDWRELYAEFADLESVSGVLSEVFGTAAADLVKKATKKAYNFLKRNSMRIEARKDKGYIIDGHGDLHCRNIILSNPPVIFDCIEFNDTFRQLDLLSEVGFLCMDLERLGHPELSETFGKAYFKRVKCIENETDRKLFLFYKLYRANVRIKVICLQLREELEEGREVPEGQLNEIRLYLDLFRHYAEELEE